MSLKFGEPKTLSNMENVSKISVKTEEEKPVSSIEVRVLAHFSSPPLPSPFVARFKRENIVKIKKKNFVKI